MRKTKKMLFNKINKEELIRQLEMEEFERTTLSFYRYTRINDTLAFRNELYRQLNELQCLGRIYIASEGINSQMSLPSINLQAFLVLLDSIPELKNMPVKYAVEDNGKSFYKLTIKTRNKIVADGLADDAFDTSNVGRHLTALEFHALMENPDHLVVDMRNNYESEVGRFPQAICPDANTFREELEMVTSILEDQKEKKILLYCTGGVRCEKASAYLKHHGFKDVNQLHGGIIEYARQMRIQNLSSKFLGKNFVFDERMGERITEDILSSCHQCGKPCDTHVNCRNDYCHVLFIQCEECREKYQGCCNEECINLYHHPEQFVGLHPAGRRWRRLSGEIVLHQQYC